MTVAELIEELRAHDPNHEVMIHLSTDWWKDQSEEVVDQGMGVPEYQLWGVSVIDEENGWCGLVTLEPGELMGG